MTTRLARRQLLQTFVGVGAMTAVGVHGTATAATQTAEVGIRWSETGPFQSQAVSDESVFAIESADGVSRLRAYETSSGDRRWTFEFEGDHPKVAAGNGRVVFGERQLQAVETTSGQPQWTIDNAVRSTPVVDGDSVFLDLRYENQSHLVSVDLTSGNINWATQLDGSAGDFAPTVTRDRVYMGGSSTLIAVDRADGSTLWTAQPNDRGYVATSAVVDGTIYASTWQNLDDPHATVYAFDASTGQEQWSIATDGHVNAAPVVGKGVVYVGTRDSRLLALRAGTGEQVWAAETDNKIDRRPALENGRVFVGDTTGTFYSFDAATGEKHWSQFIGGGIYSPVISRDGRIHVACRPATGIPGKLYTLESGGTPFPTAAFDYSPEEPQPGQAMTLDATDSESGDGELTYEWEVYNRDAENRDPKSFTGSDVTFTPEAAGTHRFHLLVTNGAGGIDQAIEIIEVGDGEPATATPTETTETVEEPTQTGTAAGLTTSTPVSTESGALLTELRSDIPMPTGVAGLLGVTSVVGVLVARYRRQDGQDSEGATTLSGDAGSGSGSSDRDDAQPVPPSTEDLIKIGDSAADTAAAADDDFEFEAAEDAYETAIDWYQKALESLAVDDGRREAVEEKLSQTRHAHRESREREEALEEVQELLDGAHTTFLKAIAAHARDESVTGRTRYRQARNAFASAVEQLDDEGMETDALTSLETAPNPPDSFDRLPREAGDLRNLGSDVTEALAEMDIETVADLLTADEAIRDAIRSDERIDPDAAGRLTALTWWDAPDDRIEWSAELVERYREQAETGRQACL